MIVPLAILALPVVFRPQSYLIKHSFNKDEVLSYSETGDSVQTISLPDSGNKINLTSHVEGSMRIPIVSVSQDSAKVQIQTTTTKQELVTPIMATPMDQKIPVVSREAIWNGNGNISFTSPGDRDSFNPAKIIAPLTILPLFAILPEKTISVGDVWQASGKMFSGFGINFPGSVAVFKLKSVQSSGGLNTATISGFGSLPISVSASQMENIMSKANMIAPALNMSVLGRVDWTLEETLDLGTGQVTSVIFKSSTTCRLHLIALKADATEQGEATYNLSLTNGS